jgi:uncharacterized protein
MKSNGPGAGGPIPIVREIPLIERYSRHNEADDIRFRTFLKVRSNLTTEQTDAIVRDTTDEVWSQIDCTKCAHCCRTLDVVVDAADIGRLADHLKISRREFARRYVRVDDDKTRYLSSRPCVFLGDDNRCTVYEHRPAACRDFPYLHKPHFVSRSMSMLINSSVCPIVFNVLQALKPRLGYRRRR